MTPPSDPPARWGVSDYFWAYLFIGGAISQLCDLVTWIGGTGP